MSASTCSVAASARRVAACAHETIPEAPLQSCGDAVRSLRGLYAEAKDAARARDEVLAVVAHDLRNPLGVISMTAELIQDFGPSPSEGTADRLAMIHRSVAQMDRLIQDLLDVARLELDGLRVVTAIHDPEDVVREALATLRPLTDASRHSLVANVASGLPGIALDRDRMLQALGNLVANAIKFTPSGGRITIGASRAPGGVRFSVTDTGAGVTPAQLPRLFDRFWQANAGDRRGLGMGLAIVKGIVAAHGGSVAAESELGRGTSITMTLPEGA